MNNIFEIFSVLYFNNPVITKIMFNEKKINALIDFKWNINNRHYFICIYNNYKEYVITDYYLKNEIVNHMFNTDDIKIKKIINMFLIGVLKKGMKI